jgi:hypothetical protein
LKFLREANVHFHLVENGKKGSDKNTCMQLHQTGPKYQIWNSSAESRNAGILNPNAVIFVLVEKQAF